jgi:hypothetical protein
MPVFILTEQIELLFCQIGLQSAANNRDLPRERWQSSIF